MDCFAGQFLAQGAVDKLVLSDTGEATEGRGDHRDLQVVAAAGEVFDLHGGIWHGLGDGGLHLVGMHHRAINAAKFWNLRGSAAR